MILLCCSSLAQAQLLEFQLNELPEEITSNINAHLGVTPQTELERSAFVYAADENIQEALNALGYYLSDVQVNVDRNAEIWQMKIGVTLNEPATIEHVEVNIIGDASSDEAFTILLENLPLEKGQVVHHGKYEDLKLSINSLGLEHGYFDGQLTETNILIAQDLRSVTVQIIYDSGTRYRFGDVVFDQVSVSERLLRELTPFATGEYFLTSSLQLFQRQLQLSGFFSTSLVLPDYQHAEEFRVPIKVELTNAPSHRIDLGGGFATDTGVRVSIGWRMPRVNYAGHSLDAKVEYSEVNPIGRINYSIPLSDPVNDFLQFQLMLENDEYGDVESRYISGRMARVRYLSEWVNNYFLRYLQEDWHYADFYDSGTYFLPGMSWSRTRRQGPTLDPRSGFSQYYLFEGGHTNMGSDISLFRINVRWKWIKTLGSRHRIVSRAELGTSFIDSKDEFNLAPSLRFYAGGDQSIRGFGYQSLGPSAQIEEEPGVLREVVVGGQNLAVASFEYQFYVTPTWRVALFTDAGNAFDGGDFDVEYSVGTGLHWISPVGAVRFELGYGLSQVDPEVRVHISLGSEF